jgi:hypothetical protein
MEIDDLDGYRLVITIFPKYVDLSHLAPAIATFFSKIEESSRWVALTDISALEKVDEGFHEVLRTVMKRAQIAQGFLGGVWVTGGRAELDEFAKGALAAAGRPLDLVHHTREGGIAHLRRIIQAREAGR